MHGVARPPQPDLATAEALIEAIKKQAALLTAVSTGGPRIADVDDEYRRRRQALIPALRRRGLTYPFPWDDLWEWYDHWSANLATYAARRVHVREQAKATLDALHNQVQGQDLADPGPGQSAMPTWADVETRIAGLAAELAMGSTRDDWQDVGRRSREIMIDCARLLADPALVPAGQEPPKAADAKRWLDFYLGRHAPGSSRAELRKLVRAAWDLAQKVTHSDLGRVETFAVAQATILVVRTLQQLAKNAEPVR